MHTKIIAQQIKLIQDLANIIRDAILELRGFGSQEAVTELRETSISLLDNYPRTKDKFIKETE
jgi:hypothetical protein